LSSAEIPAEARIQYSAAPLVATGSRLRACEEILFSPSFGYLIGIESKARRRKKRRDRGAARVVRPNQAQLSRNLVAPEGLAGADHPARLVWAVVETLDLTHLYDAVLAREARPVVRRRAPGHHRWRRLGAGTRSPH
jgi:hypothetical protein